MNTTKQIIFRRYGLSQDDLLHKGMEAEVYTMESENVLKLYVGTADFEHLTTLQIFYASLNTSGLSYSLPSIEKVALEGNICITIERRLPGAPMSAILLTLTDKQMDRIMQTYLSAALELTKTQIPSAFDRYKLFDPDNLSRRARGDWHHFLSRYLAQKIKQLSIHLDRDVTDFATKVEQLYAVLSQPYMGHYHLIHGDFFPGNILIDEQRRVTALLDFGLFTMYGDSLFDIATGWVFFDMYDELKANIRERYLDIVLDRLGERVRGKLYRYVLLYSIFSANTYSPDCADGHYRWCVANLNHQSYWNHIE